ncbi:MAG: gamma-butyrobetaine hydroxylase-like domain-containing protein [Candidatus Kapaibacteriales bacterium]
MQPVEIERIKEKFLRIKWLDGYESIISFENLRKNCPCAECQGEEIGRSKIKFSILKINTKSEIPEISSIEQVGNYAIRIIWKDGHDTGIYSFEYLRALMENFKEK